MITKRQEKRIQMTRCRFPACSGILTLWLTVTVSLRRGFAPQEVQTFSCFLLLCWPPSQATVRSKILSRANCWGVCPRDLELSAKQPKSARKPPTNFNYLQGMTECNYHFQTGDIEVLCNLFKSSFVLWSVEGCALKHLHRVTEAHRLTHTHS